MTTDDIEAIATEQSPLLHKADKEATGNSSSSTSIVAAEAEEIVSYDGVPSVPQKQRRVAGMLCLLLIGTFIGNADGSIVMATFSTISSQFRALEHGTWIGISYTLTACAAQPIVGKITDIYGRKPVLLTCYAIFAIGTVACGLGQNMWHVCIARGVSGIGGAGMGVVVSILITEMVPGRDVAAWRSYVNVVATTGRALGGPVGGWLADSVGWRWSFIGQGPIILFAMLLIAYGLKTPVTVVAKGATRSKLGRIDFPGAFLITGTIVSFILAVDLPTQGFSLTSVPVVLCFLAALVLGTLFFHYESHYASEPIYPPALLAHRNVYTAYLGIGLATASQVGMMYSVPLYFQVTSGASNTAAGARLVPAVVGNTFGALAAGIYIKRTGRYKNLTILASVAAGCSYLLMILRWGTSVTFWESLAIVPSGFGTGIAQASTFIGLTSNLSRKDVAVGTSGLYLMTSIGVVLGVGISSSIQTGSLKFLLEERLTGAEGRKVIAAVLADVEFVKRLTGELKEIVTRSYVESLARAHGFSLACSVLAFIVALFVPEVPVPLEQ